MSISFISIVVPAYNEAPSLEELIVRVREACQARGLRFEIILVDDGSTDETGTLIERLVVAVPELCVIEHRGNYGKSMSLMQGFAVANGDVCITLDADLQDQPEELTAFLEKIEEGWDLVNGWRVERQDTGRKRMVSRIYNRLVNRLLDVHLHDINCGFKAMRREVYLSLNLTGDMHRLIPAIAAMSGFRVTEIPVSHQKRKYGESKYTLLRHRGLFDIISIATARAVRLRPFHAFAEVSLIFWMIALVAFVSWLVTGALLPTDVPVVRLITPMCGFIAAWAIMVGTIMPLFGFYMEVSLARDRNDAWRQTLVRRIVGRQDTV